MSKKDSALEALRIVEVIFTPKVSKYYLAQTEEAPYITSSATGPFVSAKEARLWVLRKKLETSNITPGVFQVPHYNEKAAFWMSFQFSARIDFRLPVDEFTERLDPELRGPEGDAFREELDVRVDTSPNHLHLKSTAVMGLTCEERVLEAKPGKSPFVRIRMRIRYELEGPNLQKEALREFITMHVTPKLSVPFLGISDLPGEYFWDVPL